MGKGSYSSFCGIECSSGFLSLNNFLISLTYLSKSATGLRFVVIAICPYSVISPMLLYPVILPARPWHKRAGGNCQEPSREENIYIFIHTQYI